MRRFKVWLVLLTAILLTGCMGREAPLDEGEERYQVYYLNSSATRLDPQEYRTRTDDTDLLIQELMDRFMKVPADLDSQAALSNKVTYQGYTEVIAGSFPGSSCSKFSTVMICG